LNYHAEDVRKLSIEGMSSVNAEKFVQDALDYYEEVSESVSKKSLIMHVATYNSYEAGWGVSYALPQRPLKTVYAENDVKFTLRSRLRDFKASEDEYITAGIPYKYVALLHGPPGTGKTSLVMSLISDAGFKHAYVLSFGNTITDSQFIELVHMMLPMSCLILEDADTLVVNRKEKGGMSFSSLLNVLDGPLRPHGLVCFLTTNHIERFDKAMTRTGRINDIFEVKSMSHELAAKMATDYIMMSKKMKKPEAVKCGEAISKVTTNPSAISSFLFANRKNIQDCKSMVAEFKKFLKARPK
jgi:chaperone BCS1